MGTLSNIEKPLPTMKNRIVTFVSLGIILFVCNSNAQTQAKRPNILIAIADDMSHTSAYGYKFLKTPNFDSLAKEGVLFNHMYTPSSKCAPSRAVLLTGRNPWQLEEAANHQPTWPVKFKTVFEALADSGYFSGYTGKGWDPGIHPKGRDLTGKAYNSLKREFVPAKGINTFDYSRNFKQFLDEKPKDKPFVFWYGCKEPHRGYEYGSGVKNGKKLEDLDFLPSFWGNSDEVKNDILDYAFEIEYYDRHLGEIVEYLRKSGELENTIIILTSDNGMPFPRYKGNAHEFATRVPFAAYWPKHIVNPGRVVNDFTSFIDIAPTLLEVAGISEKQSGMQVIEGKSLVSIFQNKPQIRAQVITGRERNDMVRPNGWGYPVRSLHQDNMVYMYNFEPDRWPGGDPETGYRDTDWGPTKSWVLSQPLESDIFKLNFGKCPQEELYDIKKDPECLNNLALNSTFSKIKKAMKDNLFAELKKQKDPRVLGNGKVFDDYEFARRNPEYLELIQQTAKKEKKVKKAIENE